MTNSTLHLPSRPDPRIADWVRRLYECGFAVFDERAIHDEALYAGLAEELAQQLMLSGTVDPRPTMLREAQRLLRRGPKL